MQYQESLEKKIKQGILGVAQLQAVAVSAMEVQVRSSACMHGGSQSRPH